MRFQFLVSLTLPAALAVQAGAADDPKKIAFFETEIRPLLAEHCYKCHSAAKGESKGGLTLDTQAGWMDGGDSGAALVPGKATESLIIEAVEQGDPDFSMPPKYKLANHEIAALKKWVAMGAPDPRDGSAPTLPEPEIDIAKGREFWSFQPVEKSALPKVKDEAWPAGEIDHFILAAQEAAGVAHVDSADRRTLIRRASYDLVGLPPTPAEILAFVDDPAPDDTAFAKVVDRLLASSHFGERWGRHWLDIVRFGESMGRTRNYPFPFAWRYRDYVIAAFNKDKPYDQFVREQLAGDRLKSENPAQVDERSVATGFLALGSMDLNERDREKYKMDVVDDQIDVTARAFMALTAGCARCHDHKFDPLPTADYYALAGIFGSTDTLSGYASRQGGNNQKVNGNLLVSLKTVADDKPIPAEPPKPSGQERNLRKRLAELREQEKNLKSQVKNGDAKTAGKLRGRLKGVQGQIKKVDKQVKRLAAQRNGGADARANMAMGVRDAKEIKDCKICVRGDVDNRGAEVPRGFPQVLTSTSPVAMPEEASGRLELANWIASPEHPLTARVMANRVWHHLFGSGIVRSVDNFGKTGERPSHPKLLDHLAARFVGEHGWSVKSLVREVMLSRAYRAASTHNEANAAVDPDNRLFWRANVRRLEAEALRDSMMSVAGALDLKSPEGSLVQKLKGGQIGSGQGGQQVDAFPHRSVYLPIVRNNIPEILEVFDFAEPASVIGKRDVTTVSTQALYLLNDGFVIKQSRTAAKRVLEDERLKNREERIAGAYVLAFGRVPSGGELAAARRYLNQATEDGQKPEESWGGFMQALFASAEFRYVL